MLHVVQDAPLVLTVVASTADGCTFTVHLCCHTEDFGLQVPFAIHAMQAARVCIIDDAAACLLTYDLRCHISKVTGPHMLWWQSMGHKTSIGDMVHAALKE